MYVFDCVIARVDGLETILDFGKPIDEVPNDAAVRKVADFDIFSKGIEEYRNLFGSNSIGVAKFTKRGKSHIRGYSGGLLQVERKGSEYWIVCNLRTADAKYSPSMLDINAGSGSADSSWLHLMLREGLDELGRVKGASTILLPKLTNEYSAYAETVAENVLYKISNITMDNRKVRDEPVEIVLPENPVIIRHGWLNKPGFREFPAAVAFEPETSSIECMAYAVFRNLPKNISYYDLEWDKEGRLLDREVWKINARTGATEIWKHGVRRAEAPIFTDHILSLQLGNNPIRATSKLQEMIRQWPFGYNDGLLPLLDKN